MIEYIGEYITKLFYICTGAVICDLLCGSSNFSNGNKAVVKMVCSLCVCVTVFSFFLPTGDILGKIEEVLEDAQNVYVDTDAIKSENTVIENTRINLEKELSLAIFQNYGIKPIRVSIDFSVKKHGSVTDVTVVSGEIIMPSETAQTVLSSIKVYSESVLGCNVSVKGD
jgi:hypothetical protein